MAAVAYGHVAIVPKGIWNADTQYEVCQLVEYDGSSYVAKAQPPVGTLPTDTSYWQVSAAGTKKASSGSLGTVMPDGSTTEVNEAGKLSAKTAQQDAVGVVKGSDDITVGEDGNLTVNTEFEQATELANLIAGEAIKSVLGKVSKAIAATMNLDQNALLKNMISGIDINSGEKVPSSAFVHTLYERLGMGTDLSAGDAENVTQAVNALYSNLGYLGEIREAYLSTAITPQSGQTYTIGSLSLETGKWLLFGATLAGGDLIIDGNIISRLNGRNANINSWYESSIYAFAVSNGGIVNLKLSSNGFGTLHADKTYCGLTAVRIG